MLFRSDLLLVQFAASAAMAAIAWFVQVVHYPLFGRLDHEGEERRAYHAENVRRTRPVVLVPMVAEALAAAWLAAISPAAIGRGPALAGLALLAIALLSTAILQVPLHGRLREAAPAEGTVRALVTTNWIRTAAWSMRAALAAWMLRAFVAAG